MLLEIRRYKKKLFLVQQIIEQMSKRQNTDSKMSGSKRPFLMESLRTAMNCKTNQLHADDLCVAIADKYPKARYHWLVLPREDIPSIASLRKIHVDLIRHLERIGRKLIVDRDLDENDFRMGFHAIPSCWQLHLHVISQDFDSPSLKTKKHWNSFTTDYFVESKSLIENLEKNGIFTPPRTTEQTKELLRIELKCHRCSFKPKTMPSLKEHLKTHK